VPNRSVYSFFEDSKIFKHSIELVHYHRHLRECSGMYYSNQIYLINVFSRPTACRSVMSLLLMSLRTQSLRMNQLDINDGSIICLTWCYICHRPYTY
jgi:hypothetical protein